MKPKAFTSFEAAYRAVHSFPIAHLSSYRIRQLIEAASFTTQSLLTVHSQLGRKSWAILSCMATSRNVREKFRKRTRTLFGKGHELSRMTGADVYIAVLSRNRYYTFKSTDWLGWPASEEDMVSCPSWSQIHMTHRSLLDELRSRSNAQRSERLWQRERGSRGRRVRPKRVSTPMSDQPSSPTKTTGNVGRGSATITQGRAEEYSQFPSPLCCKDHPSWKVREYALHVYIIKHSCDILCFWKLLDCCMAPWRIDFFFPNSFI